HDGCGDQQRLPFASLVRDQHRLALVLHQLDQRVVGAEVGLVEVVERAVDGRVVAVLEQLRHHRRHLPLPEAVLGEAAGRIEAVGERDQALGVAGEARGTLGTGAGHWDDSGLVSHFSALIPRSLAYNETGRNTIHDKAESMSTPSDMTAFVRSV